MKSKYQFTKRKGRNIQVKFGHLPGKWFSTGTHDMTEAVLWAENKLKSDLHLPSRRKDKIPTLREFAIGFLMMKIHIIGEIDRLERKRNMEKCITCSNKVD